MDKALALMHALADGLTGYLTYESRCGGSQAYTEYLLYGPIVRIAHHLGWRVEAEWPFAKATQKKSTPGDHARIDFAFRAPKKAPNVWLALEVKWAPSRTKSLDVSKDLSKLREARATFQRKSLRTFLLVAGAHVSSGDESWKLKAKLKKASPAARSFAKGCRAAGSASYGVTVFELE